MNVLQVYSVNTINFDLIIVKLYLCPTDDEIEVLSSLVKMIITTLCLVEFYKDSTQEERTV
jgi:hypothetical protein